MVQGWVKQLLGHTSAGRQRTQPQMQQLAGARRAATSRHTPLHGGHQRQQAAPPAARHQARQPQRAACMRAAPRGARGPSKAKNKWKHSPRHALVYKAAGAAHCQLAEPAVTRWCAATRPRQTSHDTCLTAQEASDKQHTTRCACAAKPPCSGMCLSPQRRACRGLQHPVLSMPHTAHTHACRQAAATPSNQMLAAATHCQPTRRHPHSLLCLAATA